MSRKNESVTLSLTDDEKLALSELAIRHNCVWGNKPNISKLIQQIASGQLKIVSETDKILETKALLKSPQVKRLHQLLNEQLGEY